LEKVEAWGTLWTNGNEENAEEKAASPLRNKATKVEKGKSNGSVENVFSNNEQLLPQSKREGGARESVSH